MDFIVIYYKLFKSIYDQIILGTIFEYLKFILKVLLLLLST